MVANPSAVWKSMCTDEIFVYNADVSYLPLSEMGHMAMLHTN